MFNYFYNLLLLGWTAATLMGGWLFKPEEWGEYTQPTTVVICAYREEGQIRDAVDSVLNQDYPNLKVVVVNDGSDDGTTDVLKGFDDRITLIDNAVNRGKRACLADAIRNCESEVIVVMDSDTRLKRDAVTQLLRPFTVGSVTASTSNIKALNGGDNLLTMFQDTWYYTAYRFMKGYESRWRSVTCCSGVLSAYRTDTLKAGLPRFEDSHFLGRPFIYGDDRDLTNIALESGDVIYMPSSVSYTITPRGLRQFVRQQIRWKKGWLKGTVGAMGFIHRKHPAEWLYFYAQLLATVLSPIVMLYAFLYMPLFWGVWPTAYLLSILLMGCVFALDQLRQEPSRNSWLVRPILGLFFIPLMNILLPYALLDLALNRRQGWGTR